jgi:2-polyprenyl-3-methyl-5-hydroxy-6-metoxy-1,4-benzoquinol methylase
VSRYFDETALYWDQIYTGHKFVNWHLAHRRQLVTDAVRRLSQGRSLKILDLGSGTGVLTRDLLRMGHSVAALDCSATMVRTLLRNLQGLAAGRFLGATLGSAGEVCFQNGAFDLIICIGVIQYQPHPENIFDEIARLLKPGGACVFTVPNQLSLHHLLDPWCFLRYLYRLAAGERRNARVRPGSCHAAVDQSASSQDIYEKRYFRWEIPALVRNQPLAIRETIGFGYGPLTFVNKSFFPDRFSIALSQALARLSHLGALSGLSVLANRWVVVLEKPCAP